MHTHRCYVSRQISKAIMNAAASTGIIIAMYQENPDTARTAVVITTCMRVLLRVLGGNTSCDPEKKPCPNTAWLISRLHRRCCCVDWLASLLLSCRCDVRPGGVKKDGASHDLNSLQRLPAPAV